MSLRAAVLHSVLHPGAEAAYDAEHRQVPTDLLAALRTHGVRDWVIWREGRDLLHVVDVDDYEVFATAVAGDPANIAWQRTMAVHVETFRPVVAVPPLRRPVLVWSLVDQVAAGEGNS